MKYVVLLSAIFLILMLLLLSNIRFKITKREKEKIKLDLYIFRFFPIHIDIDEKINQTIQAHRSQWKEDIQMIFQLLTEEDSLWYRLISQMTVRKVTVIPRWNSDNPDTAPYITFLNWQLVSYLKYYMDAHFRKVKDEYYQVIMNHPQKQGISFEIELEMSIGRILWNGIKNFTDIKQFMKQKGKG